MNTTVLALFSPKRGSSPGGLRALGVVVLEWLVLGCGWGGWLGVEWKLGD